ncbi:F-box protein [Raphanus sativus]|uniref:F-box protein AUF2-like n=1 Tax=Raphanus sativus TaxID=3726 RepID=A0A6J0JPJ1_RAPSA|nr:F-box protein AUF2-like [Raphanus sativus]KAJ4889626.1 F-box protein [Raphanus sativus]
MDVFDGLPDAIVVDILNKVGDVKTLHRCSTLSKRFSSLVPRSESLFLRLDQFATTDTESRSDSPVSKIFQSLVKPFQGLLSLFSKPAKPTRYTNLSPTIPSKILSPFDRIMNLEVELPGVDVSVEKGAAIKWKAEFGKTLKTCVVVAFRSASTVSSSSSSTLDGESDAEFVTGLKTRVVWTISALIAASSRHFLMSEVVKEHKEMKSLVVHDVGREGTVVMGSEGLREFRKMEEARGGEAEERVMKNGRSVVPKVRMSMRHAPFLKLKSGITLESATLVIVRPSEEYSHGGDDELATEAFAGNCMYGEAVVALLKLKKNTLEINSF